MIGAVTLLRIASCVERFIIRNGHAESCGDLRENEPVPALAQHAHRSIWTLVAAVSSYLVTALLLSNHRFDTVESLNSPAKAGMSTPSCDARWLTKRRGEYRTCGKFYFETPALKVACSPECKKEKRERDVAKNVQTLRDEQRRRETGH
jgi:hypothetical protein